MSKHRDLTGAELHQPWHYIQENDPGAVGADLTWFKPSNHSLTYRNAANSAWVPIILAPSTANVPSGSTWSAVLAAVSAVPSGGTVILPDHKIIQTSGLVLGSKDITIVGSGQLSEIQAQNDISISGTGVQVDITSAGQLRKITLARFNLSQDRAFATRMASIQIRGGIGAVTLESMTFTDCTANVIQIFPGLVATKSVTITNCIANEWYEGFVEAPRGTLENLYITNNYGTTSAVSPSGATSRPQAFLIANDSLTFMGSVIHNLVISGNRFYAVGAGSVINTTGIALHGGTNAPCLWENVYISDNIFSGWYTNRIERYHTIGSPPIGGMEGRCLIHMTKNKFYSAGPINATTFSINVSQSSNYTGDKIFFADNDLCKPTGPGNLVVTDVIGMGVVQTAVPPNKFYRYPFPLMSSDITESFTKADSDVLGPVLSWTEVVGDFDIVSNKASLITKGVQCRARAESDLGTANHYVACVINQSARWGGAGNSPAYSRIGVVARWSTDDATRIVAYIDYTHRRVACYTVSAAGGPERPLGAFYMNSLTVNIPIKIALRCEGEYISVFINDEPVIVERDTFVPTGNFTGIYGYDDASSIFTQTYSAFEAGNV